MKTEARTKRNRKDTGFFGKPFFSKEMFGTTTALFALLVILSVGIGAVSADGPIWTAKSGWDAPDVGQGAAPAFVDLDADGDYDLFIGEQFGISFAYKNTGSASSPNWTRNSSCDLPDVGMGSKPAFADLDNDGDYDLLIGEGPTAKAYAYENTGSASSPIWTANSSWDSPSLEWNGCKPALADLDNDGDYDLLLYAASVGNTYAYENTGSASSPIWTRKSSWDPPAMGQGATSDFADLDGDGDYDLLVGNKTGATSAYENTGSASSPIWTRKSSWDPPDVAGQSAKPALADLDGDGDYDLLIGEMSGFSLGYENTAPSPLPDLVITEKSEEWVSLDAKTYNITCTVCNIGNAPSAATKIKILIDGVPCPPPGSIPALALGECYTETLHTITMSGNSDTIKLCADGPNWVEESNETNNCEENEFVYPEAAVFDTGFGTYPSIWGTHKGEIKPSCNINVSTLYTYPCAGTGGHTESIELYENDTLIANGTWNGYKGDWQNITIHNLTGGAYVTLLKNYEYRYLIKTGSYPQIIHEHEYKKAIGGTITCSEFTDANGKTYTDWIPAIRLE